MLVRVDFRPWESSNKTNIVARQYYVGTQVAPEFPGEPSQIANGRRGSSGDCTFI